MFLSGCNRIYHSPVRAHRMRPYVATRAFPCSVGVPCLGARLLVSIPLPRTRSWVNVLRRPKGYRSA